MNLLLDAHNLALKHYKIEAEVKCLPGDTDSNFIMIVDGTPSYILKISPKDNPIQEIELQIDVMTYLTKSDLNIDTPHPIKTNTSNDYIVLPDGRTLRLQSWVTGRLLESVTPRSYALLEEWGKTMALLTKSLKDYDHPAAHRFYKWNPSEVLYSKKYKDYFSSDSRREIANYFWDLFEKNALPFLPTLRKGINHNDGHGMNLLVNNDLLNPQVSGIIDFGDILYTETINELAIACAYACMDVPDPIAAAAQVIKGYNHIYPLLEEELDVLFPLICARLLITATMASYNRHNDPHNEYLVISEKPAWVLLEKFRSVSVSFATSTFRGACGMEPCKKSTLYSSWLRNKASLIHPIIDFDNKQVAQIDLSIGSLELGHNDNFKNVVNFENQISNILSCNKADYGIGGYLEVRPFYSSKNYEVECNEGLRWRTIHLGMDVWTNNKCAVRAPLEGIVYSVHDNIGENNYGPTVILEHIVSDQLTFYTLYGHLSRASIKEIRKGQFIAKGEIIAEVGLHPENGNWPTHLHFQIILDILNYKHDFPGVALPNQVPTWSSICPDPSPWFNFKFKKTNEQDSKTILYQRKKYLGKSLSLSYHNPLHIVRGYMQFLYDDYGNKYLDTSNNVPHVGHQHPRVVKAAIEQFNILNTNTRYLHENIIKYAKALGNTLPPQLSVVHFVNSGSEANELALRMMQAYTNQKDMLVIESGYHGNTGACIDISQYKFDADGGNGICEHSHVLPMPDLYRGIYKNPDTAGLKYAELTTSLINKIKSKGRNIAGFIGESILSCGGQIVLPNGYLKAVYEKVRNEGGLCIADEVQVGFGRIGKHFWGFELQDVIPDIVTMGKPMGNGHPLGAVVCTEEVATAFNNGMEYFNTFGGNPVSCAIGDEVLTIIKSENLQSYALKIGDYLLDGFRELQSRHAIIGDVRGMGLFIGIELVKDRKTLEPADKEASYIVNRMCERGILMSTDGPLHNIIKIKPPLCFNKANADFLFSNLEIVLKEDFIRRIKIS